ncbi:Lrp/AsnC family transcriptional regulator [Halalkalibacter alkaliphilus]|uniref:Lrp/AsnC family transcriptional regulator n=1 Tax=Halalkalibacter alkaliphilus TaxID=2917993 RepID=A0A9X2CUM5_9BACI|nr:Lrp/AsnC family transcriptional regulator [Halalkalibacter alkaliphilus]MCL7748564.1 Lrp/AsnC family transcriptional regulator [Halalkalibacter alkaliphilus]
MDHTDIQLLTILQKDGRKSFSDLSKELSLSRPSVTERYNRLIERGVIDKISAKVNPSAIGRDVILFIQVSEVNLSFEKFENLVIEHPDIVECHCLTGQVNYLLKAAVSDMAHLSSLIEEFTGYGKINSSIVIRSPIKDKIVQPILKR